ncbi:uncharacterized protein Bfra_001250 [Botrytis fragariae]|uniref:Uncharacterized protein n=1 Tax=Botrytis fragariae TaxID=1964551 RepID=A0A8H6B0J9_9HELO|nr:uncharacterized protein Bfra_001250 [Botrytis fragariae]KAF5876895.1 hypothetical protein Bfra_001250 [Botrytis fragariae]
MVYINKKLKKAKPNYTAAHRGHMRALEHERRASAKKIIRANIRADMIFAAEQHARALLPVQPTSPKRSKNEKKRRAAAATATKQRQERAEAKEKAEANEVASLARQFWELRLAGREFEGGENDNEDDYDDEEDEEEVKSKFSGWFGLSRKDDDADESGGRSGSCGGEAGMSGNDHVWVEALMW